MTVKTIFIIVVTAGLTLVLAKNTDEVNFWLFGEQRFSKLAILGVMFALGLIVGIMIGRPGKRTAEVSHAKQDLGTQDSPGLSDEDREYIS